MKVFLHYLFLLISVKVLIVSSEDQVVNDKCDQSKCRTPAIFGGDYSCWYLDDYDDFSPACGDGYEIQDLSSVTTIYDQQNDVTWRYYTCCSPGYRSPALLQECTDKACSSPNSRGSYDCWADAPQEPMTCGGMHGGMYAFPRKTGAKFKWASRTYSHYMCCKTSSGTPPLRESLVVSEWIRATLGFIALICSIVLILGILLSRSTRKRTFNLYLVFLAIPDAAHSAISVATALKSITGSAISIFATSFVWAFYYAANMWLNAVVARVVLSLLRKSHNARRTRPPPKQTVFKQTGAVYSLAALMGTLNGLVWDGNISKLAIITWDEKYREVYWWIQWTIMAFVPFLWLSYVCFCVWNENLIPRTGRISMLALYFARIIIVFLVCWIAVIIIINIETRNMGSDILHYAASYLSLLQTVLSTAFAMMKPDVKASVMRLLKCKWKTHHDDEGAAAVTAHGNPKPALQRSTSSFTFWPDFVAHSSFYGAVRRWTSFRAQSDVAEESSIQHALSDINEETNQQSLNLKGSIKRNNLDEASTSTDEARIGQHASE